MSKSKKSINNTVKNLFQDKCFIIFILFIFIFYIFFYDYINISTKKQLFLTFTNPLILLITILLIGLILYHNFTIGIILSIALTITMTFNEVTTKKNKKSTEGFKNKGYLMSKIEKLTNSLGEGLEENKDILDKYKNEYKNIKKNNSEELNEKEIEDQEDNRDKVDKRNNNTSLKKKDIKIKKRKFDFTKREDKAFIYSKEVLKDCIKRINYEYDDKEYLKKYIGSKIEEVIDILGLVSDDE